MSFSRELIEAEALACVCQDQQPVRRLVSYGATTLSLPFCATCGLLILDTRTPPNDLAVMRQDVAALKRLADDLREQLGAVLQEDSAELQVARVPLRVLPGGRESRHPSR